MTYYVKRKAAYPDFLIGDWVDFEQKVPDLSVRSDVGRAMATGYRQLTAEETPSQLQMSRRRIIKSYPDVFVTTNGAYVVSDRMRALIEDFDPGLHQFFSVNILDDPDGPPRFLMNIYARQTSLIEELSSVEQGGMHPSPERMSIVPVPRKGITLGKGEIDLTFDRKARGGLNLWRENRYSRDLFLSDEFVDALKKQKLKFFEPLKGRDIEAM